MPAPPSTAGFTARPPNFVPANAPSAAPPLRPPTVAAPPAPAAAPAPVGAPQPTSSKPDAPIIVVAEDDPEIRVMIVRSLATQFTVYEAPDGQAAFELLERIAPPDCIVSDVMMPRLDGLSLAKRVKGDARLKAVPFIFLTAKNSPLDVVQGINAGARHYLAKPFKVKELLEKVTSVAKAKK